MQLPRGAPVHVRSEYERRCIRTVLDLPGRARQGEPADVFSLPAGAQRKLDFTAVAVALAAIAILVLFGIAIGVMASRP